MPIEIKNFTMKTCSNLNLTISQNGLYGIIGRNGAGKSTLFTAINGEMKLKSGTIHISGNGRVAYVPTLDIFDQDLNAMDYIKLLRGEERENAERLLSRFQAERFFNKKIKTYSLGMKEILAFIYSLSVSSDLIIIDELMNGLDHAMRELAFEILKEVSRQKTVLLTSHILEEIEKFCDDVYFLSNNGCTEVTDFEEAKTLILENQVFI